MIKEQKKQLRAHYRAVRADIAPEARAEQCREICARILQSDAYKEADSLLLYAALGDEIDLSAVARDAWRQGKAVAYPRCLDKEGRMAFYVADSPERLIPGSFGIPEPDLSCPEWQENGRALCILPALAVDVDGHRLGYGKGFYDRYIDKSRMTAVGVIYSDCIEKELPRGRYDLAVHFMVTDKGVKIVD